MNKYQEKTLYLLHNFSISPDFMVQGLGNVCKENKNVLLMSNTPCNSSWSVTSIFGIGMNI